MSKSVLVMETSDKCLDCNLCVLDMDGSLSCYYNKREICSDVEENNNRPDWCPLRPLPEKRDTKITGADWNCGYNDGWNACVDEIIIHSKSPEEIIKYYENKNIQIKRKAAQEAQTSALTTPLEKPLSNAMFNGMT